jgi:CRISPR-associated endonuclease/helicase Cas3
MLTFSQIQQCEELDLSKTLKDSDKYYAHWKENRKELLVHHTGLTMDYCLRLCEANQLEPIIDQMILDTCKANLDSHFDEATLFIKSLFLKSIFFHDFGKVNENFQVVKMKNDQFSGVRNGISSDHSILSAYLYLADGFKALEDSSYCQSDRVFLFLLAMLFAHSILKHHGKISNPERGGVTNETNELLSRYLSLFTSTNGVNQDHLKICLSRNEGFFGLLNQVKSSFQLFSLLKLNSSLLTASDYYSTNEFMLGIRCADFGILDDELRNKIHGGAIGISYNSDLLENRSKYQAGLFENLQSISNENLNILRQKLSCEVLCNLEKHKQKRLFYIEAPTGSGKTNLSLLALADLLKKRKDITKVFYVFPFTTLITQTAKFIIDNLKLTQSECAEIHSKAAYNEKTDGEVYGAQRKNYIDNLFVNYPISLISHIKFFDVLTSNEKEANYLLHRVANSIVIIDEIQSYNPTQWDKVNYLLNSFSETFNITFVVMSATLPKIGKLLMDKDGEQRDNFVYLVGDKQKYFQNPNFKNRVVFRFDLLDEEFSFEMLLSVVHERSEAYHQKSNRVRTIVEFVTKKSAQIFFEMLSTDQRFGDYRKYVMTGNVLEPRRKEIIGYLKSEESNRGKVIIVATQVVEAGLDIDMDLGFKDKSIVDAEEQLAGRINRNATKSNCELFLFKSGDSIKTYRTDLRHKQNIGLDDYKTILSEKDFDSFYDKVFQNINDANRDQNRANNLSDFQNQIRRIDFQEVHKQFELIGDNTVSIFVPLQIQANHFSDVELKFLRTMKAYSTDEFKVVGENVWNLYTSIIENRDIDFIERKIDLRILSSILSKFAFSMWNNRRQVSLLKHYSNGEELKYGFLYLQHYESIYSYDEGLQADIETDCNFL